MTSVKTHAAYSAQLLLLCIAINLTGCSINQPITHIIQPTDNTSFWIDELGPTGPIITDPQQYPFICMTLNEGLGQPIIDNHQGKGNAVFRETFFGPWIYGKPIGYSQNCSIKTRVDYYYFSQKEDAFLPLKNKGRVPTDVERIVINDEETDFVIRVERGTINRFLYSIAMLAPYPETTATPNHLNNNAWNNKLVSLVSR